MSDKQDETKKGNVKADDQSIAIGSIDVRGNFSGNITIGGYSAEEVSVLIEQISSTFQPKPFDGRPPYKGLDVFEGEDAELFFGREKIVADLVERVKESRTVFITGPSGSGKSSLVRAGLIPALKRGELKNSERWLYETVKPGRDPVEPLALAFSRLKSPELGKYFRENLQQANVLHECAESALSGQRNQRLVLFFDQFEEVFTQVGHEETRAAFLNLLTHAATVEDGRVIILFAMRSDFVSNCATYPELNGLLNQQFVQIGAMEPDELVSAIAQPALRVGLRIDPDLVAQIINDMQGEPPGALPLMQFALKDLFEVEQAKGGVIALTREAYLERGGIQKSLERHADASFAKLEVHEQELARSIFSGLIEIGRGTQDTRRKALFDELVPSDSSEEEISAILQKLGDARLVTTEEDSDNEYTITHEKLIDAWPWLKKLVNENRDVIALQNQITTDAKEWEDRDRDSSYLYTGARLANAREQLETKKLSLSGLAQDFVQAGFLEQQRAQRTRFLSIAGVVGLIVAGIILFFYNSTTNANKLAEQSKNSKNTQVVIANIAQAASTQAVEQQLIAEANAEEAQRQANIALARQLAVQAQSVYGPESSKQTTAVLLAVQSMKVFPSLSSAQILGNNTLPRNVSKMTHDDGNVYSVSFSPDGRYVVSGSGDGTARVWEAQTGREIARMTHDGGVWSVSFSPDGKYVVTGSWDGTARVWEAETGQEVARMTHGGDVWSVSFSPDGRYVVSGSLDGTARVWEAQTGHEIARMTHDDNVWTVAFSPDGRYVVSGSGDGTARVWEAETGQEVARVEHDGAVYSVAFSPDSRYVASGSDDGIARVWEAQTGHEIAHMTQDGSVNSVAFNRDSRYVVIGSGGCDGHIPFDCYKGNNNAGHGTVRVWDVEEKQEVARITHDGIVYSVSFSPDGRYVVSGSLDDTARVWEVQTGREIARMTHDDSVWSVYFSPDGKYVVSGSLDNTIRVWAVETGQEVTRMTHDGGVWSVSFSPDGRYVASGGLDDTARVWESETGQEIARMTHGHDEGDFLAGESVTFSPDGRYVASGGLDDTVRVWEAQTGQEVAHVTHGNHVYSISFSPDGKYVVSGSWDGTARVWEAQTGQEIARMTHDDVVWSVSFSPDGRYVVSGSAELYGASDNTARVWEAETGQEVARMTHNGGVPSVAFSPDGRYVASGGLDDTARVWEAQTGREIARMTHDDVVWSVSFSPDGKYVVTGSWDGTARVWEAETGQEVARMTHGGDVYSVSFSPDGKYVVSGSEDGTARVWDAQTGQEIARMTHDGGVLSVAISPDGRYIVSGGRDGTARVWIWQPNNLIASACSRVSRNLTRAEWEQYIGDSLPYQAVCEKISIEP